MKGFDRYEHASQLVSENSNREQRPKPGTNLAAFSDLRGLNEREGCPVALILKGHPTYSEQSGLMQQIEQTEGRLTVAQPRRADI